VTVIRQISIVIAVVSIGLSALAVMRSDGPVSAANVPESDASVIETRMDEFVSYDEFGFDRERYATRNGVIRRNETLSDILQRFGASAPEVAALADISEGVFDVRDIRAGRPYRVYTLSDSVASLVYEASSLKYVVFDLEIQPSVEVWKRPILVRQTTAQASIESSLYESLMKVNADIEVAFSLSEIFAWQIDFHHLLPGDEFTVVYDQRFVGGEPAGIGTIHGARFVHGRREFSAFHFDKQGDIAYFDEEGNSLRKTFLAAPVRYSRISSRYTGRRFHPVLKRYKAHLGTDYAAPRGTPIVATGDGEVTDATYRGNNGRYVKIRHNGTYTTAYLHMSRIADGIRPGTFVRQGDVIGYVGSTGLARGNHVCYRFWKHGHQVDPLRESFPSAEPVAEENVTAFVAKRDRLSSLLRSLAAKADLPPYALVLK
jgi:murein DD-endopeptidase MepM/ murein hydrolase activator NlpD